MIVLMTPWIKKQVHLWQLPALIFVDEYNFLYEDYGPIIVISHKNLFSIIQYIENHFTSIRNIILEEYIQITENIRDLSLKIITLKKILQKHDHRTYYFFNCFNDALREDHNIIEIPQGYRLNSGTYKKLPHFHNTQAMKIYYHYQINNDPQWYFWDWIIEICKLWSINQNIEELITKLKKYNITFDSYKLDSLDPMAISYPHILSGFQGQVHQYSHFWPWIQDDTTLNHLLTINGSQINGYSLLWKSVKGPILLEGNGPEPQGVIKDFIYYSTSDLIYYGQKKSLIAMGNTNWNQLIQSSHGLNPLPWRLFHSKTMEYDLNHIINLNIYGLWLESILGYKYEKNNVSFFLIKSCNWSCYGLPLEPWVININHDLRWMTLKIPLDGCFWTKNNGVTTLVVMASNPLIINLLIFFAKKQMKNEEIDNTVVVVNGNYEIINKVSVSLAGYFLMNMVEERFHRLFL